MSEKPCQGRDRQNYRCHRDALPGYDYCGGTWCYKPDRCARTGCNAPTEEWTCSEHPNTTWVPGD